MITSANIKNLRIKTGAGMMDCKKALEETNGDLNSAVDWLRKKGISTAQKKSNRDASEGLITITTSNNMASIVEINSETDFVARNLDFQNFCAKISEFVLNEKIRTIDELNRNNNINQDLTNLISKVGENLVIKRLKFIDEDNLFLQKYIHGSVNENSGKIGVLIQFHCDKTFSVLEEFSKNICMHIAASEPKSLTSKELDEVLINKEKEIYREQLKNSGKPDEIIEKILVGKMNKFYEDVCLYEQFFVMENKIKVKEYISSFEKQNACTFKLKDFIIFKVGDNL